MPWLIVVSFYSRRDVYLGLDGLADRGRSVGMDVRCVLVSIALRGGGRRYTGDGSRGPARRPPGGAR